MPNLTNQICTRRKASVDFVLFVHFSLPTVLQVTDCLNLKMYSILESINQTFKFYLSSLHNTNLFAFDSESRKGSEILIMSILFSM